MGVGPAVFQSAGQRTEHYVPGAYSRSAAIGGGGGLSAGNAVILGKSGMGAPWILNVFTTVQEAKEILGDGELLKAVAHAFNPSPDYAPQRIMAMVVNGNTQAGRTLSSGAVEVLRLKSAMYGLPANQLKMQVSAGTNPGTRKAVFTHKDQTEKLDNIGKRSISLQYTGPGTSARLDVNNTGITVEVDGANTGASMDIEGLNGLRVGEWKEFTLSIAKGSAPAMNTSARILIDGVDPALLEAEYRDTSTSNVWTPFDLSEPFGGVEGLPLSDWTFQLRLKPLAGAEGKRMTYRIVMYKVVAGTITTEVVSEMTAGQIDIVASDRPYSNNSVPSFDAASGSFFLAFEDFATIEDVVARLNETGVFAAVQLETESNIPANELDAVLNADVKTQAVVLKSDFYALFHALENSYYVGRENIEKAEGAPNAMPDNDADPVYFDGAQAGTYTIEDWDVTLCVLEAENIQILSTPSTDQAVHTLISNHCTAMSSVQNRKERTALLGGPIGETIDAALERAAALNSKLVTYCYPSISALSPLTGETENLPASYFACKLLGMESAVAVNEPLTWKNVSVLKFLKKLRISEMEKLIIGGILCGGVTDDNRLAVIRAMTTYQGSQLQLVERSMVREDLYMNRDIRQRYSPRVGRPGIGGSESDVRGILMDAARDWKGEGLIVPTDAGDNVWGIIIRISGDKTYITFCRNLTAPQNFFFITANNYVYESATTIEV